MQPFSTLFKGPFTGWHMLTVMCLFFAVIIAVNVTMAVFAGSSWSGLIVKNTYVASQTFNEDVDRVKKMKAKGFAAAVKREDIVNGAEDLGVELNEHIQFVIDAMAEHAEELGLLKQ